MSGKWILLILLVITLTFCHYYNKHQVIKLSREYAGLKEKYGYLKSVNSGLLTENNSLSSRTRIQKLAYEELGMFFPDDTDAVHLITFNPRKQDFCLIDYVVPSAEALTRE